MTPGNFVDITGMKFGKLTVVERAENGPNWRTRWVCQCDCYGPNSIVIVNGCDLKDGKVRSCGCLHDGHPKHNMCKTRLYKIWANMKSRCNDPNAVGYEYYGGRGIVVCEDWQDFTNFKDWALSHGYDENLTIDRINVNLNYNPDNCQWVTQKAQQNNKRNNIYITYFNETHTLAEWCDILNLPYDLIYNRMHCNRWDFWKAISTPLPDHYYEDCYDYDYSNEYYEDPYEYDNCIYDE